MKIKINDKNIVIASIIAIFIAFFMIFGILGARFLLTMMIIFFIPMYFIVKKINIHEEERIVMTFFLAIGIVPTIIFYYTRIHNSFRVALLVSLLILCGISLLRKK